MRVVKDRGAVMFNLFNLSPENMVWFYLAPLAIFGPVFFAILWNFGLKNLFHTPPEYKEQRRLEREQAERITKRRESKAGYHARVEHPATRPSALWLGQAVTYGAFAAMLGVFSAWPGYSYTSADEAQVKLSLSHPGQRVEACRKRSQAELNDLAPNMRAKMQCSRERWPVVLELEMDGQLVFSGKAIPAGLRRDGASSFYEKFHVPAGKHTFKVRMNDAGPEGAFDHTLIGTFTLKPAQNMVIGFREDGSGFFVK